MSDVWGAGPHESEKIERRDTWRRERESGGWAFPLPFPCSPGPSLPNPPVPRSPALSSDVRVSRGVSSGEARWLYLHTWKEVSLVCRKYLGNTIWQKSSWGEVAAWSGRNARAARAGRGGGGPGRAGGGGGGGGPSA